MLIYRKKEKNLRVRGVKYSFNYYFKESNKIKKKVYEFGFYIRNRKLKLLFKYLSIKYLSVLWFYILVNC